VSWTQQIRVATFDGPGAAPVIRSVPRPKVPANAALLTVAACGVCGTDLHILAGHWPKPLPRPFTLGHEVAGITDEIGPELTHDYMGNRLRAGDKIMIPPLMPFSEAGIVEAVASAREMRCVNATVVPRPDLAES